MVGSIATLSLLGEADFGTFFGPIPPVLAATGVCASGIGALFLLEKGWAMQAFDRSPTTRNRLWAMCWAVPFIVSVTVADLLLGFPQDINVALPAALLFYPAMAAVAQITLHLIPLLVLLWITDLLLARWSRSRRIGLCIAFASLPEALFQIPTTDGSLPQTALALFVFVQLFCFGVAELLLLRRYDYLAMYCFRLSYYAWWHITWGTLRLL